MISLLPDDSKKELRAAHTNVMLFNYLIIVVLGIVFLGLISAGVYIILMSTKAEAEKAIVTTKTQNSSLVPVEKQVAALHQGLTSAKTIFNDEVLYTKVLTRIASLIPAGVVLDNVKLDPSTFGTPTTMQFYAKTNQDALALKDSFQASSYFSNVSFQSLSNGSQSSVYPVSALLSLTLNKSITK